MLFRSPESDLIEIIKKHKRRNPEIGEKAQGILDRFQKWRTDKKLNRSFDPSGRRLDAIKEDFSTLVRELSETQKDSLELTIKEVGDLLEPRIPTYEQLGKAYKILSGRGMKSSYVEDQLKLETDDNEIRITIAEKLEDYMTVLANR